MADLNRIHIKEAPGCNNECGSPQEYVELIILWCCDLHRETGAERAGEARERRREGGMKTSVKERFEMIKILVTKH